MRRVCDCTSGSQSSGNHRSLGQLCFGCACLASVAAMDIDAIGALSRQRNRDGNQLFVLYRNCSLGDRRPVKGPKGPSSLAGRGYPFSSACSGFLSYTYE